MQCAPGFSASIMILHERKIIGLQRRHLVLRLLASLVGEYAIPTVTYTFKFTSLKLLFFVFCQNTRKS